MKGKWNQTKGAVKKNWGKLTDDDIQMFLGEGEQLVGKLQERYGYSKERAESEVAEFLDSLHEELPLTEEREKTAQIVRNHPWTTGLFFVGVAIFVAGFVLSRFVAFMEKREETSE